MLVSIFIQIFFQNELLLNFIFSNADKVILIFYITACIENIESTTFY